jgi:hypothetical protein
MVRMPSLQKHKYEVLDQDSICIKGDLLLKDSKIYCFHQLVLWLIVVALQIKLFNRFMWAIT